MVRTLLAGGSPWVLNPDQQLNAKKAHCEAKCRLLNALSMLAVLA